MRALINDSCVRVNAFAETIWNRYAGVLLCALGVGLLSFGLTDLTLAQTGGEIFQDAATQLACVVMPGKFGALLSTFTGIFALIAAATGNYRGAWALVFVSVGAFIFKEFVAILFGDSVNC